MTQRSLRQRLGHWLAAAALVSAGFAVAQAEPTLQQIYDTAQSGKVADAQVMVQQVLVLHPKSAKAHFVQAELFARQGLGPRAREALAAAETLAPGLPFAKPEAVAALRTQLSANPAQSLEQGAGAGALSGALSASAMAGRAAAPASPTAPAFPLGLGLALGGAAIGLGIYFLRRKPAAATAAFTAPFGASPGATGGLPNRFGSPAAAGGGLSGPQTFGMGANTIGANTMGANGVAPVQAGYAQPQGQPAGSGIGGRVMGGLATGLAVGAGVMAAQAIGRSFSDNQAHGSDGARPLDNNGASAGNAGHGFEPLPGNNDLGGQNFGINYTGGAGWDDGGDSGGGADLGGDWDA